MIKEIMEKEVSKKKFLSMIGLGVIAVPLLSKTVLADWFFRTETNTYPLSDLVNANQTSIKKTTTFGKTWTTGDSVFIKTKQVFLANASFVRVYKNNVLQTYTTDWAFNGGVGENHSGRIGNVADLVDGVEIISPTNGAVYRIEYDEYIIPYNPQLGYYRTDGLMCNKGLPKNSIGGGEARAGSLKRIDEVDEYSFNIVFQDISGEFSFPFLIPDKGFCTNFNKAEAFPTNWRMEMYKVGRFWNTKVANGDDDRLTTMNCVLSPRAIYSSNVFPTNLLNERKKSGQFKIRMRNTVTNEVSLFSLQTIKGRNFFYIDGATKFGRFRKITIQ